MTLTPALSPQRSELFRTMRIHRGLVEMSSRDPLMYDAFMALTQDRAVYAALDELEAAPDLHEAVERDPMRFLDERGISVPAGLQVAFTTSEAAAPSDRVAAAAQQRKFFIGFQDSGGMRWGYEGGPDGRGVVCGR